MEVDRGGGAPPRRRLGVSNAKRAAGTSERVHHRLIKQRLIHSVARLQRLGLSEKRSRFWEQIEKTMGRNCQGLWEIMCQQTSDRVQRLLECGDAPALVPPPARMTPTDWLLLDSVLVHSDNDLFSVNKLLCNSALVRPLVQLFHLVQQFELETCAREHRAAAWSSATHSYNRQGKHSSPMLLQRRWWELKKSTRESIYRYSDSRRRHAKLPSRAPVPLHVAIARRFPQVVVEEQRSWSESVAAGLVVLPHQFERLTGEAAATQQRPYDGGRKEVTEDVVPVKTPVDIYVYDPDSPPPLHTYEPSSSSSSAKEATLADDSPLIECVFDMSRSEYVPLDRLESEEEDEVGGASVDEKLLLMPTVLVARLDFTPRAHTHPRQSPSLPFKGFAKSEQENINIHSYSEMYKVQMVMATGAATTSTGEECKRAYSYTCGASRDAGLSAAPHAEQTANEIRKRSYSPLAVSTNPDFNTNLRGLAPAFLESAQNRQLLKLLRPVTVDVERSLSEGATCTHPEKQTAVAVRVQDEERDEVRVKDKERDEAREQDEVRVQDKERDEVRVQDEDRVQDKERDEVRVQDEDRVQDKERDEVRVQDKERDEVRVQDEDRVKDKERDEVRVQDEDRVQDKARDEVRVQDEERDEVRVQDEDRVQDKERDEVRVQDEDRVQDKERDEVRVQDVERGEVRVQDEKRGEVRVQDEERGEVRVQDEEMDKVRVKDEEREEDGEGESPRKKKRVSLPDISEVRRERNGLPRAQVSPLARAPAAPLLTLRELDEILENLTRKVTPAEELASAVVAQASVQRAAGESRNYCCLARRHRSLNDARRRLLLRKPGGRARVTAMLHGVLRIHTCPPELCKCCCKNIADPLRPTAAPPASTPLEPPPEQAPTQPADGSAKGKGKKRGKYKQQSDGDVDVHRRPGKPHDYDVWMREREAIEKFGFKVKRNEAEPSLLRRAATPAVSIGHLPVRKLMPSPAPARLKTPQISIAPAVPALSAAAPRAASPPRTADLGSTAHALLQVNSTNKTIEITLKNMALQDVAPWPPPLRRWLQDVAPRPPPPPRVLQDVAPRPPPPPRVLQDVAPRPPPPPRVLQDVAPRSPPPPRVLQDVAPRPPPQPRVLQDVAPRPPPPPHVLQDVAPRPPPPPRVLQDVAPRPPPPPRVLQDVAPDPPPYVLRVARRAVPLMHGPNCILVTSADVSPGPGPCSYWTLLHQHSAMRRVERERDPAPGRRASTASESQLVIDEEPSLSAIQLHHHYTTDIVLDEEEEEEPPPGWSQLAAEYMLEGPAGRGVGGARSGAIAHRGVRYQRVRGAGFMVVLTPLRDEATLGAARAAGRALYTYHIHTGRLMLAQGVREQDRAPRMRSTLYATLVARLASPAAPDLVSLDSDDDEASAAAARAPPPLAHSEEL